MANIQIINLPIASPLTGTEDLPVEQGATTVKTTVTDVAALATLQTVLDNNPLAINSVIELTDGGNNITSISEQVIYITNGNDQVWVFPNSIRFDRAGHNSYLKITNVTADRNWELPNASGILAVSTTVGYSGSKTIGGQVYTWQNGILISVV
jgi:hypothetical protein